MITQGGYQGITIYNGTTDFVSTRGIRDVNVSIEPEYVDLANGLRRPISYRRVVSMTIVDHSVYDQLVTWADALTAVQFVLVGQSKCLQGYDDTYINLVDQFNPFGDVNGFRIELVNTKYSPTWYTNTNLLWSIGWADGVDSGEIPDGYTFDETSVTWSESLTDGVLKFSLVDVAVNNNNVATLYRDVILPFPGIDVTASTEITDIDNMPSSRVTIGFQFFDIAGASISSTESNVGGSTGRKSITATLPANTYKVRVFAVRLNDVQDVPDYFEGRVIADNGTEVAPTHTDDVWDDVKTYVDDLTLAVSCNAGAPQVLFALTAGLPRVSVTYPSLRVDGISAETLY